VIWALLAASILVLPVAGVLRRFRLTAILSVIVLLECSARCQWRQCPLSDLAARYTARIGRPTSTSTLPNGGGSIQMKPPFRSAQAVIINAPLEAVWVFSMDITKIPEFHPRVVKVELLSGKALREPGVSYQCYLSGGKHTCVEKDIEILPMQKIVTVLPEDTFGISKIWPDYVVETTFHRVGQSSTRVEISHYYSTPTLKAKLLNLVAKRRIARDSQATLNAAKAAIETAQAELRV
jgi:hypothetical protein